MWLSVVTYSKKTNKKNKHDRKAGCRWQPAGLGRWGKTSASIKYSVVYYVVTFKKKCIFSFFFWMLMREYEICGLYDVLFRVESVLQSGRGLQAILHLFAYEEKKKKKTLPGIYSKVCVWAATAWRDWREVINIVCIDVAVVVIGDCGRSRCRCESPSVPRTTTAFVLLGSKSHLCVFCRTCRCLSLQPCCNIPVTFLQLPLILQILRLAGVLDVILWHICKQQNLHVAGALQE